MNNLLFCLTLVAIGGYYYYILNESSEDFETTENKKISSRFKQNNYDEYDDFNRHFGNDENRIFREKDVTERNLSFSKFHGEDLEEINQLFIPQESIVKPDDRDNEEKYIDSVNEASCKGKLNANTGRKYLIDEFDDPVDKINSYRDKTRKGDMGKLQNVKISEVYDYMTKGIDFPRKKMKQPMIDETTMDPLYANNTGSTQTLRPDQWMYENEDAAHGGHMGNGLFGHDLSDQTQAVF